MIVPSRSRKTAVGRGFTGPWEYELQAAEVEPAQPEEQIYPAPTGTLSTDDPAVDKITNVIVI